MKNYRKLLLFVALFSVIFASYSAGYAAEQSIRARKATISSSNSLPMLNTGTWVSKDFLITFSDSNIKDGNIKATFKDTSSSKIIGSLKLTGSIDLTTFVITGSFDGEKKYSEGSLPNSAKGWSEFGFHGTLTSKKTNMKLQGSIETANDVLPSMGETSPITFGGDAELGFSYIQSSPPNNNLGYDASSKRYPGFFSLELQDLQVPEEFLQDDTSSDESSNSNDEESFIGPAEVLRDDGAPTLSPFTPAGKSPYLDNFMVQLPSEKARAFREVIEGYYEKIPKGKLAGEFSVRGITLGQLNAFFGSKETVCGGYQDKILSYLQGLQFSNNPAKRTLMEEFDYGPIQITKGGHQAVVIYPKGKNWKTDGLVLDPWVEQKPEVYSISYWSDIYIGDAEGAVGNYFFPIEGNIGRYPTTPNADGSFKYVDEVSPFKSKKKTKRLMVKSPVFVLVKSTDGKRVGIDENGQFVNDFGAEVDAYMFLKPDKTYTSSFSLPVNKEYSVAMTGSGSGDVHVFASTEENTARQFTVAVKKGDNLKFYWDDLNGFPNLEDANEMNVSSTEFTSPLAKKSNTSKIVLIAVVVILMIVAILLVLAAALALIYFLSKRNKAKTG